MQQWMTIVGRSQGTSFEYNYAKPCIFHSVLSSLQQAIIWGWCILDTMLEDKDGILKVTVVSYIALKQNYYSYETWSYISAIAFAGLRM